MKPALVALFFLLSLAPARGRADDVVPGGPGTEPVDTTRLDVERLPPEAATLTPDLYDRGLFLEAQVGGTTFVGEVRDVSRAGPRIGVAFGYELARWFSLLLTVDGSMHGTKSRPPPAHTSYELVAAAVGARFTLPFRVRYALWLSGSAGAAWSSGDVLRALGFRDAWKLGLAYGGELGFDWHMRSRHHSLGLLGGARLLPNLARDDLPLSLYGSGYLRYVF